jgi:hypothetical protein
MPKKPDQVIEQIKKALSPEVTDKFTPSDRVDLVMAVARAMFHGPEYETADLISEAMGPYREDNVG